MSQMGMLEAQQAVSGIGICSVKVGLKVQQTKIVVHVQPVGSGTPPKSAFYVSGSTAGLKESYKFKDLLTSLKGGGKYCIKN